LEEIARVYTDALFEAAKDKGDLDRVHDELDEFADVLSDTREMQAFLFSPYFSTEEKKRGLEQAVAGASPEFTNFLELLVEKHRMPVIFRIRTRFDELWAVENRRLEVTLTSAVELDKSVAQRVRKEIERQTEREIDLQTSVDPDVLGGLVLQVGNMVVDASLRSKLDRLRKEVAAAA
jgi:F-type H+-transporting ATPase subunit delta